MAFNATVTMDKGLTIKCRIFDPATGTWWTGTAWSASEGSATLTTLSEKTLADPYYNRYYGVVQVPSGGDYVVEYVNSTTSECVAEDPVSDSIVPGYRKGVAIANFEFVLLSSTDHISPATGKTVTAERSLDGGTFSAMDNTVTEISNGTYKINMSVNDTNATIATYKFSASGADTTLITVKFN